MAVFVFSRYHTSRAYITQKCRIVFVLFVNSAKLFATKNCIHITFFYSIIHSTTHRDPSSPPSLPRPSTSAASAQVGSRLRRPRLQLSAHGAFSMRFSNIFTASGERFRFVFGEHQPWRGHQLSERVRPIGAAPSLQHPPRLGSDLESVGALHFLQSTQLSAFVISSDCHLVFLFPCKSLFKSLTRLPTKRLKSVLAIPSMTSFKHCKHGHCCM